MKSLSSSYCSKFYVESPAAWLSKSELKGLLFEPCVWEGGDDSKCDEREKECREERNIYTFIAGPNLR